MTTNSKKPRERRGHGEGSITQRGDGRWVGRLGLGWQDGKRVVKHYYGRTRQEVADKLTRARAEQLKGVNPPNEKQTVEQYLTQWLEDSARPTLRPNTFTRYEQLVKTHVLPYVGKTVLARLTPQQITSLYSGRLKAGLSPRTVQFLHAVLHRALKQAVLWDLVARNPCDAVRAPRPERKDMAVLSREQAGVLLAAVEGDPLEALYVLAVTTGMRSGELLGLTWGDIDGGRVAVRHTLQRVGGTWQLLEPKTQHSRRNITLSSLAVESLRRHRVRQNERRLAAGPAWQNRLGLVFCDDLGRPLDCCIILRHKFRPLLERAGLPRIRFHDLRHTAATLLLSQGVHPKKVQDLLGHCTASFTLDIYSHVTQNMQDEVAATMDSLLSRPATVPAR